MIQLIDVVDIVPSSFPMAYIANCNEIHEHLVMMVLKRYENKISGGAERKFMDFHLGNSPNLDSGNRKSLLGGPCQ